MAKAVTPGHIARYVLKADREEENPTVFLLGQPTLSENAKLESGITHVDMQSQQMESRSGEIILDTLRICLKGWENFYYTNEHGEEAEVPFVVTKRHVLGGPARDIPTDETLQFLTPDDRQELAEAATNYSALEEGDLKN